MRALLLLLSLMCGSVSAESIYVVQSKNISSIYEDSVAQALKRLRPEADIRVLMVRDFHRDRFSLSKEITERMILRRAAEYDNLILLGYDVSFLQIEGKTPLYIPVLVDNAISGNLGPASPSSLLHGIEVAREHTTLLGSSIYILSDSSNLSQLRSSEFKERLVLDKSIRLKEITVKSASELRGVLVDLNTDEQGVIVNNVFSLLDDDTYYDLNMRDVDEIISDINRKHVEVSVLKSGLTTAIGFGVLATDIAEAIDAILRNPEEPLVLPMRAGVNLDRVTKLHITDYVIGNAASIVSIEVKE